MQKIALLLFVLLWFSLCHSYGPAIQSVIEQDAIASGNPQAMRAIDTSKTPKAFRNAYEDHIRAWEGYRIQRDAQDQNLLTGMLYAFVGILFENPGVAATGGNQLAEGLLTSPDRTAIKTTWAKVKGVAREYGVEVKD